jgi:phosphoribosylamine--glycine ligase
MERTKALLVGDGAREHAIAEALSLSTREPLINAFMAHVNPGIRRIVEDSGGSVVRGSGLVSFREALLRINPDLVIIGPEEPQFAGFADTALELGIPTFGATAALAMIEKSKVFARGLMWRHRIPGRLAYRAFRDPMEAMDYVRNAGSVAIKPARQSGGRGVRVFWDDLAYMRGDVASAKEEQVMEAMRSVGSYGDMEDLLIVEEAVAGVEYTIQVITDGRSILPLPPVQDHPHVFDDDLGPECGGMGSISGPNAGLPFLTREEYEESVDIVRRTLDALQREVGGRYVGVLSGQFMLTARGPTLIEYYSRFGDPEVVNALARLRGDLLEIIEAAVDGSLGGVKYSFGDEATVVKAMAPLGYPHRRSDGVGWAVFIDEGRIRELGCRVYLGSLEEVSGVYRTLGSRALEVLAVGGDYGEAHGRAEECIKYVTSDHELMHRFDIGHPSLVEARVREAQRIREVYTWRRMNGLGRVRIDWVPGRDPIIYDYS